MVQGFPVAFNRGDRETKLLTQVQELCNHTWIDAVSITPTKELGSL